MRKHQESQRSRYLHVLFSQWIFSDNNISTGRLRKPLMKRNNASPRTIFKGLLLRGRMWFLRARWLSREFRFRYMSKSCEPTQRFKYGLRGRDTDAHWLPRKSLSPDLGSEHFSSPALGHFVSSSDIQEELVIIADCCGNRGAKLKNSPI